MYRFLEDGEVVCFCSSDWHNVGATQFYPTERGNYRFRISASGFQSAGKPVTFRVDGGRHAPDGKERPGRLLRRPARQADRVRVRAVHGAANDHHDPPLRTGELEHGAQGRGREIGGTGAGGAVGRGGRAAERRPGRRRAIAASSATWRRRPSPINNYGDRVEVVSNSPVVDAERILRDFARRAFRRTVTDDDVEPFVALVKAKLAREVHVRAGDARRP